MQIDQLIRSRRKTIALIVQKDGSLVVRAPMRISLRQIQKIVDDKASWITAKREQVKINKQVVPGHQYASGENFFYLGKSHPLEIVNKCRPPLHLNGHFLLDKGFIPEAYELFTRWYKVQARREIGKRVAYFAALYGFTFLQMRITSARTRWGSCSAKGGLNFSWRLVMAPPEVIDYVVLHELAHLAEHNHGPAFWAKVKKLLPEYAIMRRWLKENGHLLNL